MAEEMRRQAILASFRIKGRASLASQLIDANLLPIYPKRQNSIFAAVPLDGIELSEDFDVAELLVSDSEYAFACVSGDTDANAEVVKQPIFEVEVVGRRNYGFEAGINQSFIHLCFSPEFVYYYKLNPSVTIDVEVQFNLSHDQFSAWIKCIDLLARKEFVQFVLPNLLGYFNRYLTGDVNKEAKEKVTQMIYLEKGWKDRGKNNEQIKVLRHIVMCALNKSHWVPPFVIYGPFGTGKTRTLAEAVCTLLMQKGLHDTKILICTQSNSTAELYLKTIEEHGDFRPDVLKPLIWRIVPSHTKSENLQPFVRPYVRFNEHGKLEELTLEKLKNIRVVISTTSGVQRLTRLLDDTVTIQSTVIFTHIFLDEAAQGMEVELLQPLCIASKMTCVVVAGDHRQIRPTVYFSDAEELQCSYLERLYNYYEEQENGLPENVRTSCFIPKVLFKKNYRCHKDILSFLSNAFYGGESKLQSCIEIPESNFKPMYFAMAVGQEQIMPGGISYSNQAEILEVLSQVHYFWNNWPDTWGEKNIGVVVGSFDQVKFIREGLKAERCYQKKKVDVGKTIMMQGKEFKVIIISTVRGRNLFDKPISEQRKLAFLDDARLINTAMSRTQYCLVVVGDPFVLCSIGKCKNIWQRYIDICFEKQSFLPEAYTSEMLKGEIEIFKTCLNGEVDEEIAQLAATAIAKMVGVRSN